MIFGSDVVWTLDLSTVSEQQISFKVESPSSHVIATEHAAEISGYTAQLYYAQVINNNIMAISTCIHNIITHGHLIKNTLKI